MGTFKFTWAHPAEEVYVTGTFDNWTKSERLDKVGDSFEKTVTLPETEGKIYYKVRNRQFGRFLFSHHHYCFILPRVGALHHLRVSLSRRRLWEALTARRGRGH
ncbi:uncharacterized protein CTRU02_200151 [Colletotrichum truncatum]|uniref:Uncharacterized protein n=1 Tax=Colletotrichum truncatum TaxID=5467 RepID=A0ACC3ZDS7_COLTU